MGGIIKMMEVIVLIMMMKLFMADDGDDVIDHNTQFKNKIFVKKPL